MQQIAWHAWKNQIQEGLYFSNILKIIVWKFYKNCCTNKRNSNLSIWGYSNLPHKYAPVWVRNPVKCANFLTKIRVHTLLFEHVMHNHLSRMHAFFGMTFNVSLLTFRWNVSNERHNASYICRDSVWTTEQSNRSWMWRTTLCRASKPLKWVALSNSANVSIGWISVKRVASSLSISRCDSLNQRV